MEFDLGLGEWIIIGVSAFLFIWYFAANSFNRRRGIAIYRWLYKAHEELEGNLHAEWIGSSNAGARLHVEKASKPFRRVESIYLLEPREFLPYWIFSRLRAKRDEVIIKITLRIAPKELVAISRIGDPKPDLILGAQKSYDSSSEFVKYGFQFQYVGGDQEYFLNEVEPFLLDQVESLSALELRSIAPHLEIRLKPSPLLRTVPDKFYEPLSVWLQGERP